MVWRSDRVLGAAADLSRPMVGERIAVDLYGRAASPWKAGGCADESIRVLFLLEGVILFAGR